MSANPQAASPLARLAAALTGLPGGESWQAWRAETLARLLEVGLPTPREDAWKYTNLRLLGRRDLAPAPPRPLPADALGGIPCAAELFQLLVFVDGRYHPALSRPVMLFGIYFQRFAELLASEAPGSIVPAIAGDPSSVDERVRALNGCLSVDGPVISVPACMHAPMAVQVVHVATGGGAYPRTQIDVGEGAHLTFIETHVSLGDAEAFVAAATDIRLRRGARMWHTSLQLLGERAVLLDDVRVSVGPDACYEHCLAALGGQLSRLELRVALEALDAKAELSGLIFADRNREQHVRTLIEHRAPRTASNQLYRGVAAERGRGSYDGKVIVHPGAAKAESRQSSRNLLIGSDASIETRPQLEINADDVKCSHGATTGTLDEQMMFYLLSRGLDRDTARALLTYAFVGDVLRRLSPAQERKFVQQRVLGRLPAAELVREFVS